MSIVLVHVGLDYHEDSIRVCVMDAEGKVLANRDRPNDVELVAEFVLNYGYPQQVAIEACCGAAAFAHELEQRYSWRVRLAHPGYVNRLRRSPDKSDHDDARLLADLLRVGYLPEVWLASEEVLQMRRLVRYRAGLSADRKNMKLRIRALLREERVDRPAANPWTKAWMQWLREEARLGEQARWVMDRLLEDLERANQRISEVEVRLAEVAREDSVFQKLMEQPGVGLVTAAMMRAEIGDFHRFGSGKQLSRFCSVTPLNATTGKAKKKEVDAGMVRQGNPELRRVLIQAAHSLSRHDEKWKRLKRSLRDNGKPANVATVAVANRWVRWLYHQMIACTQPDPLRELPLPAAAAS